MGLPEGGGEMDAGQLVSCWAAVTRIRSKFWTFMATAIVISRGNWIIKDVLTMIFTSMGFPEGE